jgi:hypothetical protein
MGNRECYIKDIIKIKEESKYYNSRFFGRIGYEEYTFKTTHGQYVINIYPEEMEELFDTICLMKLYSYHGLDTYTITYTIEMLHRLREKILLINNNNNNFFICKNIKFIFERNMLVFYAINRLINQSSQEQILPKQNAIKEQIPKQHSFTIFIDAKCPVCLEEITKVFIRQCKHGLCENCNKKVDKCPICRN